MILGRARREQLAKLTVWSAAVPINRVLAACLPLLADDGDNAQKTVYSARVDETVC